MPKSVGVSAGHWLNDPGACYAPWIENILNANILGSCISYLASHDVYPVVTSGPLSHKVQHFNMFPLLAAVDIHFNAVDNHSVKGAEVIYLHKSEKGKLLAQKIYDSLLLLPFLAPRKVVDTEELGRGDLAFLKKIKCPSVIVEPCWLSNPQESQLLQDPAKRAAIGEAIARGILAFI
jgi:N-acetylmuramoyl-L-alanine amidase